MRWRHLGKNVLLASLAAALGACGSVEAKKDDANCITNERFFSQKIWQSFMGQQCFACHNAQGTARNSDLLLQPSSVPDYLRINMERVEKIARTELDGRSLLLLKPIGLADHEGGVQIERGSDEYKALEEMVDRFRNPVVCTSNGDDPLEGVELRDLKATLRKASLSLAGRLPTDEEVVRVEEGGEEALRQILDEIMLEDAFYERLKEYWNDLFLTDRYLGGTSALDLLDTRDYPNRDWYRAPEGASEEEQQLANRRRDQANRAVAREALELVAHVVREERPFTEVVTANYRMVNPFSARTYGVDVDFDDAEDPNEWREARVEGIEHAGVLTSHMILNRFPTTPTNRNRARARMVFRWFLATDLLKLAERPVDSSDIEGHNPTMNNPECTVCHEPMDPVAGAFMNWDERGRYRPPEEGWFGDMRAPGYGEAVVPSSRMPEALRWLGEAIAADPLFVTATVQNAWTMLTGQPPLSPPSDPSAPGAAEMQEAWEAQNAFFSRVGEDFVAEGYNFKAAIRGLVLGPYYRADNLMAGIDETARLEGIGPTRLLTPEMLDRQIRAVLGYPWSSNATSTPWLLNRNEYRMFYGGIDSVDVVERITAPNGVMANVAARMANEMACRAVPRDFALPSADRKLFPAVEIGYQPEDDNGFEIPGAKDAILANIAWLHERLLGETLYPGDPELERTYQLFYETWKEGKEGLAAGTIGRDLPGSCRVRNDFWTGQELPEEQRLERDDNYTVRAWMAVTTYLLLDFRFLYE